MSEPYYDFLRATMIEIERQCVGLGLKLPLTGNVTGKDGFITVIRWPASARTVTDVPTAPAPIAGMSPKEITILITDESTPGNTAMVEFDAHGKPSVKRLLP